MSSLRLALKQSLQETGHMVPKDKRKKSGSGGRGGNRRRPRQPGDPPRKRGRPRKHPLPTMEHATPSTLSTADSTAGTPFTNAEGQDDHSHATDHESEPDTGSENEFSYDSEEEEEDSEEGEDDADEEEAEDEEGDAHDDETSQHVEGEPDASTSRAGPLVEGGDEAIHRQKKSKHSHDEHHGKSHKHHSAANTIQSHWKKKKGLSNGEARPATTSASREAPADGTTGNDASAGSTPTSSDSKHIHPSSPAHKDSSANSTVPAHAPIEKKKRKKEGASMSSMTSDSKSQTVAPPTPEVLEWSRSLSEKRCRRHVAAGLRVKVRFAAKVKRDGKVVKKKIWYGGRVSAVSKEGSKIRIKYDDGTSEISKFPDKDVVVCDAFNGKHQVPADKFTPPAIADVDNHHEEEEDHVEDHKEEVLGQPAEAPEQSGKEPSDPPRTDTPAVYAEKSKAKPKETSPVTEKSIKESSGAFTPPVPEMEEQAATGTKDKKVVQEVVQTTPVPMETSRPKDVATLPHGLGSPEDGELSPGLTFPSTKKASPSDAPTLMETDPPKPQSVSEPVQAEVVGGENLGQDKPVLSSEGPKEPDNEDQPADGAESKVAPGDEKVVAKTPSPDKTSPSSKPSLTIRITNIRSDEKESPKITPKTPKSVASDSEGELFADTPVTERKVKSIQLKKKSKRKRDVGDTINDEQQPSKKRIHLKKEREVTPQNAEDMTETPQVPEVKTTVDGHTDSHAEKDKPTTAPEMSEELVKKESKSLHITLRKPESEKKKKERSASPVPKGRKSPMPRSRSPTPRSASPVALATDTNEMETAVLVDKKAAEETAHSQIASNESTEQETTTLPKRPLGSKDSAFSRKPAVQESQMEAPQTPGGEVNPPEASEGTKLSRSKGSTDSLPSMRTGRRAAQQAKEKLSTKHDQEKPLESGKKKKRKRKEGENEGEHSDVSVDDRQWVQCDSCGKWRILPSSVKISSLPKHWYCHLNTYDPKRNTCAAPEQTAKQAAKDWRRARKRAKQQRLEQQAVELDMAQEEPKKESTKKEQVRKELSKKEHKKDLTPTNSPKPTKASKKIGFEKGEGKRASPPLTEDQSPQPVANHDTHKHEKKGKKSKVHEAPEISSVPSDVGTEPPKKPGRKRGRPARNATPQKEKGDGDNVEWVQCEKCEKWRKLPPHISADELPDTWYCSMNTWNPGTARCEAPEDQADSTHHEVGTYQGVCLQGAAGKYSYRTMIFGNGKKHHRPMSERSRAAESLFMRPIDDVENHYPSVMYSKSSAFLPRTSNFTKASTIEEEKAPGIFDVLSNSDLWAELRNPSRPAHVASSNGSSLFPKFVSFENLPDEMKQAMRKVVLHTLGSGTLTGDLVIGEVQSFPWGSLSGEFGAIRENFNADIIINTLLALVRDGVVEMTCLRDPRVPMAQWVPRYRKVRSKRASEIEESIKSSRFMKIAKPWKHREESHSEWISGHSAFS